MKFRVDRDVLADAVAWTARTLPIRPSAPVLAGLLIEAGTFENSSGATGDASEDGGSGGAGVDGLQLSTFDYETSARATLSAEVSDEGRALVSGRLLADICRSLPNKPVEMSIEGAKVTLTCGSARFSLQTMPVEDYPTLPQMPEARGTVNSSVSAENGSYRNWSVCRYQYAVWIICRGGLDQSRPNASCDQPVMGLHFSCPT